MHNIIISQAGLPAAQEFRCRELSTTLISAERCAGRGELGDAWTEEQRRYASDWKAGT